MMMALPGRAPVTSRLWYGQCTSHVRQLRPRFLSYRPKLRSQDGTSKSARSRAERTISRLPQFLQRFATPLYNAPVTHVTSFVVLHEITAIVPLFGLAGAFHYWDWLPPYFSEGKWVHNGMEKFGNYFRKKGWLGEEGRGRWKWWGRGEGSVRIVVEFATAYAITKAFLPLRVILSIWATPWFAKTATVPIGRWVKRLLTKIPRKNPTNVSAAKDASAPTKAIPTITSNRIISNEKGGAVR